MKNLDSESKNGKQEFIPALDTIKTMLKVARILSLVLAIVLVLWGFISGIIALWVAIRYPAVLVGPIVYFIFGVIDYVIYTEIREINALVDSKRYAVAKEKTLIWAVIGLILGGILPGIFLLIAYIKYDEVIRATASSSSPQLQTSAI